MQKLVKVLLELVLRQYPETRRSDNYMLIHLAPTEGWRPFGPIWMILAPSTVAESSKPNMFNLV